jgi:ribosomal protein S18 acetylase RimI-like enzyme
MSQTPVSNHTRTALTVVVEPAGFGDLGAVAAIQRESFRPGLAYSRVALMLLWALPIATFLVARDSATGDIVGNVITDRYRGNTRIVNIAVARDARRRGIARQMLWAIDQQCPEGDIVLAVEESNLAAQRLYEREGYIRTSVNRDYYGVNNHGYTMKKVRRNRPASVTSP